MDLALQQLVQQLVNDLFWAEEAATSPSTDPAIQAACLQMATSLTLVLEGVPVIHPRRSITPVLDPNQDFNAQVVLVRLRALVNADSTSQDLRQHYRSRFWDLLQHPERWSH